MPVITVPRTEAGAVIEAKVNDLEAAGAINVRVTSVGDVWMIQFDEKPRVGRPPKTETR